LGWVRNELRHHRTSGAPSYANPDPGAEVEGRLSVPHRYQVARAEGGQALPHGRQRRLRDDGAARRLRAVRHQTERPVASTSMMARLSSMN
jgi:hypothetical protein